MSLSKFALHLGVGILLSPFAANAQGGYVLGLGGEVDSEDGRAFSLFADYGISEDTWLSAMVAKTDTSGRPDGLDTIYADLAFEHTFRLIGGRLGAAYWGDNDILDSNDLRGSVFVRARKSSLTFHYERRDFDFVFAQSPETVRTVEFSADGIGASGWLKPTENTTLFLSGMSYDYSRDIRLQPRIDTLRFLSSSRLSLMNSLIDHRISGGFEYRFGQKSVDVTAGSWQTAVDGGKVNSISIGFVSPIGSAADLELRLALDDSENFGNLVAFAITLLYFGG